MTLAAISKKWLIVLIVLTLLLALRFLVPELAFLYLKHKLKAIPNTDISIASYHLSIMPPRLSLDRIHIQVHQPESHIDLQLNSGQLKLVWQHGFKLALYLHQPELHIQHLKASPPIDPLTLWQSLPIASIPLHTLTLDQGQFIYDEHVESPSYRISLTDINLQLKHLQQTWAELHLNAQLYHQAPITLALKFMPKAAVPSFKLEAELQHLSLPLANPLLAHYTQLITTQGSLSVYVEAASASGQLSGYVKPLIENLEVALPEGTPYRAVKEVYRSSVQALTELLTNNDSEKMASLIPIQGQLDQPDSDLYIAVMSLLKNAFIYSILPGIDHSIELKNLPMHSPY